MDATTPRLSGSAAPKSLAKPEAAIYHHATQGLQTPAPNILFIDDRIVNVEAAQAVGMQTIHYLDHPTFEQEMYTRGLSHLLEIQTKTAEF